MEHITLHGYIWNTASDTVVHAEHQLRADRGTWPAENNNVEPRKARDQALSLWSGSTDSKTLDYQRTNPAAAPAELLQLCLTLCNPIDSSSPAPPHPWDSPGKNTGVGCHFLLQCMKVKRESEVAQSCPTLRDPMDCSLPGSFAHGVFQARVLEWGAIAFSGTNRRGYQIVRTHTKETTRIQDPASPNHQ